MRKITRTITAAFLAAALTAGFVSGAGVYAEDNITVNESVAASQEVLSFGYAHCRAYAADSEGNIYYAGSSAGGKNAVIFKADRNNKITASTDMDFQWGNMDMKLSGGRLAVTYREADGFKLGRIKCRVYEADLSDYKEYSEKSWGNDEQLFDSIGSCAVWYRKNKLYIGNSGGSARVLADLTDKFPEEVRINGVALSDKYAAFSADGKKTDYIGYVDIKTGEVTVKAEKDTFIPRAFENGIVWYSDCFPEDPNESIYAERRYFTGTGRICTLTDDGFTVTETESGFESMNGMSVIDSEGRLITLECDSRKYGDNKVCFHVYENKKAVGTYYCENPFAGQVGSGFGSFTADGGKIAVTWCGTSDGNTESLKWVKSEDEDEAKAWIDAHSSNVIERTVVIDYTDAC